MLGTTDGGSDWLDEPSGTSALLHAVSCPDASSCLSVGSSGVVLATTNGGKTWRDESSGTDQSLWGVACASTSSCVAVGDGGTIIRSDNFGISWVPERSGTTDLLTGISCPSSTDCVTVGNDLEALASSDGGSTWKAAPTGTSAFLAAISCPVAGTCLAAGNSMTVDLTTDQGAAWSPFEVTGHSQIALWGVSCPSTTFCVAVGSAGTIVVGNVSAQGSSGIERSGTSEDLHGVDCPTVLVCYALGASGTILASSDGGRIWTSVGHSLNGVSPVKVLVTGDSVSMTLGFGLASVAGDYGVQITNDAILGCGVTDGGPIEVQGQVIPAAYIASACNGLPGSEQWPQIYAQDVAATNPDVALLLVGRWETVNRYHDGQWSWPGQPAYDAYLESQLETAVRILSARGARVALLTSPYFDEQPPPPGGGTWPEDQPARVQAVNSIIYQVAAQFPGTATVIDLNAKLDPGGAYASVIDGVTVRTSDGVHITLAGGVWLAPWLLPKLVALAAGRPGASSYWEEGADGGVYSFGDTGFFGSIPGLPQTSKPASPVVGMAATPDGGGYWELTAAGGVYAFGDAPFYGSLPGLPPQARPTTAAVALVPTPNGGGYWEVTAAGGVYAFGDAPFEGSMAGSRLAAPVVGMAATPDGDGYWLVGADGGIFAFGDAPFEGSMAGSQLAAPVVGITRI